MRPFHIVAAVLGIAGLGTLAHAAEYTVTVPSPDSPTLQVTASFELGAESQIGMYITSSPQLTDGQADLVESLRATRDGEPLPVEYAGGGDWQLDAPGGTIVEVAYDIRLEHDRYAWGPGIDEVGYRHEDGLFFTGYSLFVVPLAREEASTVRFDLPDDWRASTPWREVGDATYEVAAIEPLVRNCLFLGTHLEETITIDDFTFLLAMGTDLADEKPLVVDAMRPVVPAYVKLFGGMPNASRYLVVINRGDRADGGAFLDSYSMLVRGEVNRASQAVWGHGIAHELLHFWNGLTIAPETPATEEWFKEGFTDYYTIVQLARTGLDTPEITHRKLENSARRYVLARKLMGLTDSMRDAGAEKHRNRFLVYGGGTLAAFALDVQIRQATANARSLDDVMAAMYTAHGATGERYTYEDIQRIVNETSGTDLGEFFAEYVDGTGFLDPAPTFTDAGLQLTTMVDEFYVSERADASELQRAIREGIFGPRE